MKSPDDYTGKAYTVWACISQFDAATGSDSFRAQAYYKKAQYWYLDGTNALFTGDATTLKPFVAGDVVLIQAMAMGSFAYDTTSGGKTTVPLFLVATIARKGSC